MKLISIDVGIKNLACCIFDISNNNYTITSWDIVDLCETKKEKCICLNKNNKICNNNAIYHKNGTYYCKKHAGQNEYLIPSKDLDFKKIKKKKLPELIEKCNYFKLNIISPATRKNLISDLEKHINTHCLEKIETINANNVDLISIGIKINELLSLKYNMHFDIVLIENQISPIANRMKTIQGMLCQYFIMKETRNIIFVSSMNKLKEFGLGKLTYSERKKKSVEITKDLISEDNIKIFDKSKKKDDLADCFLQGLWYLRSNKLINYTAKNLKI